MVATKTFFYCCLIFTTTKKLLINIKINKKEEKSKCGILKLLQKSKRVKC